MIHNIDYIHIYECAWSAMLNRKVCTKGDMSPTCKLLSVQVPRNCQPGNLLIIYILVSILCRSSEAHIGIYYYYYYCYIQKAKVSKGLDDSCVCASHISMKRKHAFI